MSFCTLTLAFLCLLCDLPLPAYTSTKWNLLVLAVRIIKKIQLFTPFYWVVSKCHTTHLGLENLLFDTTLCSTSLELVLFCFQVAKCYSERLLRPFTRHNFKNSVVYKL